MSAISRHRARLVPTVMPLSALPHDADERAVFNGLVGMGVVTGREPAFLAVLDAYRATRPLLQSPSGTARFKIPEVLE